MLKRGGGLLLTLALGAVAAWPLWADPGLINTRAGGDSPFLLVRLQQLVLNLEAGVFPVRWMPDAAYGRGYPFFHFYASLPFYLAAALKLWGLGYLFSLKATQSLGFIAATASMYLFARRLGLGSLPAAVGALAYGYAPFHLVNIYVRGDSLGEFYAFVFYPLIFGALLDVARQPSARPVAFLGLSYAALILSHNISALIFTPFVGLYALVLFFKQPRRGVALAVLAGLGLGLALSAWFWMPALAERGEVHIEDATTGYFHFSGHFRGIDLVQTSLLFDYSVNPAGNAFAMGLVQAALALVSLGAVAWGWIRHRQMQASAMALLPVLFLSTFLILPASRPIWESVPLLGFVQFPWRFLSVQAFAASALLAVALQELPSRFAPPSAVIMGGSLLISSLAGLRVDYLAIEAGDITTERLALYEHFTRNIGSTVRQEYLPRGVETRPFTSSLFTTGKLEPIVVEGALSSAHLRDRSAGEQVWELEVDAPTARIAFPLYYFRGWRAYMNGQPVEPWPVEGSGLLGLTLAEGHHEVVLRWGTTPLRAAVELVSALALVAVTGMALRGISFSRRSLAVGALSVGLIVIGGGLAARWTIGNAPSRVDDLSMDFRIKPYLHHNPEGIGFGAARLLSYEYSAEEVAAGESLGVTLRWAKSEWSPLRAEVRLVGPITVVEELTGVEDVLAEENIALGGETTRHRLRVPERTLPGLYFLSVRLFDARGELPPLDGGGTTYLRPIRVITQRPLKGDEPRLASMGESIVLSAVETLQIDAGHLEIRPTWYTTRPLARDYAVSLRLYEAAGRLVAARDTQPGYGFFPTSVWPVNELVSDRLSLELPAGTPPGEEYRLELVLYKVADLQPIGVARIEDVSLPLFDRVGGLSPEHVFSGGLSLLKVEPLQVSWPQGEPIVIQLGWGALAPVRRDFELVLGLKDDRGRSVYQQPVPILDAVPSSRWPAGAFIQKRYSLELPDDLPLGLYHLTLGVREVGQAQVLGDEFTWKGEIQIERVQRNFAVPEMEYASGVDFGGNIELLGFDVDRQDALWLVSLHWRARREMEMNYSFFVHLFDPSTERILAQWDGVPRQYPTSRWAQGEVVSAQIALATKGIETGRYRLATGIYDPRTGVRLAAQGENVDQDRAILIEDLPLP